jgi:cell wall-associated NlpC family hydrolase
MQCHKPAHGARTRYVSALLAAGALLATVADRFGGGAEERPEVRAVPAALDLRALSVAATAATEATAATSAPSAQTTREPLPAEPAQHPAKSWARRQSLRKERARQGTRRSQSSQRRSSRRSSSRSRTAPARHSSAEALKHLPTPQNVSAAKAVREALALLGVPYVWGGTTRAGFDCSGFTQHIWAVAGVKIPRTVRAQARAGKPIPLNKAEPGDLVVFYPSQHHVGVYVGDGMVIDSPHTGSWVRPDPVRSMPVSVVVRVHA